MFSDKIEGFLDSKVDNIIKDCIDLISIPSLSTGSLELKAALRWTIDKARSMGFKAESLLDDRVGIVELGNGDETLGILTHLDVVGIDNISDWETEPFKGQVIDGAIWGRGAIDDKGPLISSLYAMKAVENLGLPLEKKIQLIIGTQEEVDWTDMDDYVKSYPLPDYGFTPDGEFPGTNREKGYADIGFSFERHVIEHDDTGLFEIVELNGGLALNAVPSSARAVLKRDSENVGNFCEAYLSDTKHDNIEVGCVGNLITITAKGVATHSCFPEKGVNAICELSKFLNTLPLKKNGGREIVSFICSYFANDIYGKNLGLYNDNDYINGEFIHRTVISPTILETNEINFEVKTNLRTSYGTTREDLMMAFERAKDNHNFDYNIIQYLAPIYVDRKSPFVRVFEKTYGDLTGLESEFSLAYGTSYAKAMPNIVAWGPIFPGEPDYCHEANERISIDSLMKATKIYANAIGEIVLSKESFK